VIVLPEDEVPVEEILLLPVGAEPVTEAEALAEVVTVVAAAGTVAAAGCCWAGVCA